MKMDQIDQMDQIHKRKCLLADRCGLSIRDYWQTVQKIFMGTSALPQSFEKCRIVVLCTEHQGSANKKKLSKRIHILQTVCQ